MLDLAAGLKNSLIIMELLRDREELQDIPVLVGTFTNCREVGLTFYVHAKGKAQDMTFCVYQHRNSDDIIINGKSGYISLAGELPYISDNKYEYLGKFAVNEYTQAAECLLNLILEMYTTGTINKIKGAQI